MWTFISSTGELLDPTDTHVETGYAGGDKGLRPEGRNNPAYQYTKDVGPLPVGLYVIGVSVEGSHLGPLALPLLPDPANNMGGRGDFFIHGDHIGAPGTASNGCIIMSHSTRQLIASSVDRDLQVIER
jgi:Protein of unknown function (DUF2778)